MNNKITQSDQSLLECMVNCQSQIIQLAKHLKQASKPWELHLKLKCDKDEDEQVIKSIEQFFLNQTQAQPEKNVQFDNMGSITNINNNFTEMSSSNLNLNNQSHQFQFKFQPTLIAQKNQFLCEDLFNNNEQSIKQNQSNIQIPQNHNLNEELDQPQQWNRQSDEEQQIDMEEDEIYNQFILNATLIAPQKHGKLATRHLKAGNIPTFKNYDNEINFENSIANETGGSNAGAQYVNDDPDVIDFGCLEDGGTIVSHSSKQQLPNRSIYNANKNQYVVQYSEKSIQKELTTINDPLEKDSVTNRTIIPMIQNKHKKNNQYQQNQNQIKYVVAAQQKSHINKKLILDDISSEKLFFMFAKQFDRIQTIKDTFKVELELFYDRGKRFEVEISGAGKEQAAQQMRDMAKQVHYMHISNERAKYFKTNSYTKHYGIGYVLFGVNNKQVMSELGERLNNHIQLDKVYFVFKKNENLEYSERDNKEAFLKHTYIQHFELKALQRDKHKCILHLELDETGFDKKKYGNAGIKVVSNNPSTFLTFFKRPFRRMLDGLVLFSYTADLPSSNKSASDSIQNCLQSEAFKTRLVLMIQQDKSQLQLDFIGKRTDCMKFFNNELVIKQFQKWGAQSQSSEAMVSIPKKYYLNSDTDVFKDFIKSVKDNQEQDVYEFWLGGGGSNISKSLYNLMCQISSNLFS